jgi:hypothetical protein
MKKTNRTYQVYVANLNYTRVLARGKKSEMKHLFEQAKDDPEYDCVILSKWNERYHCWDAVEKHLM